MSGGGGDNSATERQKEIDNNRDEARKRLNIQFGIADPSLDPNSQAYEQANMNKDSRTDLYNNVRQNAFTAGKRGLDENYEKAKRNNAFSLFAQGLNGGSEDINQNALVDRTYKQGLMDLGAKADSAQADLKTNDETARLNLLNSINAGVDQTSALSSAMNQLQNNYDDSTAKANSSDLGDLFATSGALYTKSNAAAGKNAASTDWWNTFSPSGTNGKSRNANGIITGV